MQQLSAARGVMGIYAITCIPISKVYIGSACDIGERFYAHRGLLRRRHHKNCLLQAAWDEHGEVAFDFRIIEVVDDLVRLRPRENAWLREVQPFDPVIGFNLHENARGRGYRFTPEQCERVAAALRGKAKSPEHVAAMRARPVTEVTREAGRRGGRAGRGVPKAAEHRSKIGAAQAGSANHRAKLTEPQVREIKRRLANGERGRHLAAEFGVHESIVSEIKSGRRWRHVTA